MNTILEAINSPDNQKLQIFLTCLALFRVFLEIKGVDLTQFPFSKMMVKIKSSSKNKREILERYHENQESLRKFHKMGLYFSLGYLLFVAPQIFFS